MENKDMNMSQPIEILKKHFANCFDKDGNFIPSRLQEVVQDNGIGLSKESYHLNWLGKSYARLLANEGIKPLFKKMLNTIVNLFMQLAKTYSLKATT
jgi:adenine-specific DNA-methyltransferase